MNKIYKCLGMVIFTMLCALTGALASELTIQTPSDGARVVAGSSITVSVRRGDVFGGGPLIFSTSPQDFPSVVHGSGDAATFNIPAGAQPGKYKLIVMGQGKRASKNLVSSSISIYIDTDKAPTTLKTAFSTIYLGQIGDEFPISIEGNISKTSAITINGSSDFSCSSSNERVARVGPGCGKVIATGFGQAEVNWKWREKSGRIKVVVSQE